MSLLLIAPSQDMEPLKNALLKEDSNLEVEIWPKVKNKERVTFAVSWRHPKNVLDNYSNLKAISSFGAGVNHILTDDSLPENTRVCRIITEELQDHIADYVLNAIGNYRFHTVNYVAQKNKATWKQHFSVQKEDCAVGIMGLGELGKIVGKRILNNGYKVSGWSRSRKDIDGITSFAGQDELNEFLSNVNILICLLPLTTETEGILDLDLFKQLKKPAYLVNIGRGAHLVEEDLIYALDADILVGACLDVFEEEPLPSSHTLWNRKNIMITPHVAGLITPEKSAPIIVENYKRSLSGMELLNEVDRKKGY